METTIKQRRMLASLRSGGMWTIWWKGQGKYIHGATGRVVSIDEREKTITIESGESGYPFGTLRIVCARIVDVQKGPPA